MKPFPWKCVNCRERAASPAILPTYTTNLDHDGKSYEVVVENLDVLHCANCGHDEVQEGNWHRIQSALRSAAGILEPSQIRASRESLGLSQREVASFLKVAESTLSRWETGAQMQQRSMDQYLRLFFTLDAVRDYLGVASTATIATT